MECWYPVVMKELRFWMPYLISGRKGDISFLSWGHQHFKFSRHLEVPIIPRKLRGSHVEYQKAGYESLEL